MACFRPYSYCSRIDDQKEIVVEVIDRTLLSSVLDCGHEESERINEILLYTIDSSRFLGSYLLFAQIWSNHSRILMCRPIRVNGTNVNHRPEIILIDSFLTKILCCFHCLFKILCLFKISKKN